MGRGRSKAKHTKVARDLKYSNQEMDIERLAKELHGDSSNEKDFDEQVPYSDADKNSRS